VEENINMTVVWNMMPYLADWYQRYGGICMPKIYVTTFQTTVILTFSIVATSDRSRTFIIKFSFLVNSGLGQV
jgi:hypothetical protein